MIVLWAFVLWVVLGILNLLYESLKRRDWHRAHERIVHQGIALSAFVAVTMVVMAHQEGVVIYN